MSAKTKIGPEERGDFVLELTAEEVAAVNDFITKNPFALLQIPRVREILTSMRIQRLKPEDIRSLDGGIPAGVENVVKYNIEGVTGMWSLSRPSILINPFVCSQYFNRHAGSLEVLSIGPRTEAEIFALVAAGFNPKRIRGMDIISYSPYIDLGDMHDMPYEDDSFDVIFLGWVLAYSTDNKLAVSEVMRVAKPNAFIAIGCEYNPKTNEEISEQLETTLESPTGNDVTRFETTDQILELFEGSVETILYRDDVHPTLRHETGGAIVIFQLKG